MRIERDRPGDRPVSQLPCRAGRAANAQPETKSGNEQQVKGRDWRHAEPDGGHRQGTRRISGLNRRASVARGRKCSREEVRGSVGSVRANASTAQTLRL